jgi:signal transduction histidine kinase/ActR/RegA family two-component response regulator
MNSKIRVRLVWRLVLCLFGHLTLLLILAIYLELSLNSVRSYTPVVRAEEVQLESLDTIPALLTAMDAERHDFQRSADPQIPALYRQAAQKVQADLDDLQGQLLLASPNENDRRAIARQWLSAMGTDLTAEPAAGTVGADLKNQQSRTLLDRLDALTEQVRSEVSARLLSLQREEASDASNRVSLMWILVGSVMVFTILIQLGLAQTIVGPIQTLQNAVRRLQAGDYTARAHLRSGDEVQNLGETFNAMAESILHAQRELQEKNGALSAQQEALRHSNANLEERVVEKTRELEEKNQKLKEAARLKDEFLATLSHELRTPLTPVITCAHLLAEEARLGPEHLKSIEVIERNARALSRMIDELLDLSAVMNHKLRLVRERTEMNDWIRATLETMRPAWEKKDLSVRFTPAAGPVELEIDPTRLAQVLTNLINNAIKFTEPGGQIEVRLTSQKKETRIAVTDTGAGLNRHEIEQIFEIFHQTRTQRTKGVGGLGVGLSVARSLAELHGGGLRAESPGLGRGATFILWLPPSQTGTFDFSSGHLPAAPLDRTILRGRRVLLVEDATDTREALQRLLQRRGCRVSTAATGEQARELAQLEFPDVLISDIGLPGLSGLELIAQLRTVPELRDMIAIALSGLGRERDVQAAATAGFDAHLLKPVEIGVLDQTLVELLQRKAFATQPLES